MRTRSDGEIYTAIVAGATSRGMPAFADLAETARWQLVSFVRSLGGVRLRVRATDGGAGYPWDLPPGFPQPKVPADNPMTPGQGRARPHLFYDTRLSADGTFSCGTCHEQRLAFTDGKPRAVGHSGQIHPRSAMALANVAYLPVLTWANPTVRRLEAQALVPMFGTDPVELGLNGTEREMLARLAAEPRYPAMFAAAFPGEPTPITVGNVTRAIASFERTLLSGDRRTTWPAPAPTRALSRRHGAPRRGPVLLRADRMLPLPWRLQLHRERGLRRPGPARHRVPQHRPLQPRRRRRLSGAQYRRSRDHAASRDDMGRFKAAVAAQHRADRAVHARRQHPHADDVVRHYEAGGRTIAAASTGRRPAPTCTRARW